LRVTRVRLKLSELESILLDRHFTLPAAASQAAP
jgi:hypothetical protein